ncbi:MAG: hypothetical protein WCZ89_08990 [Phycisphaerae bacterium]
MLTRIEESSGYCGQCLAQVSIRRKRVRHWPHLLLTIFTGVWLIVWIIETRKIHEWHCMRCGKIVYKVMQPLNNEYSE